MRDPYGNFIDDENDKNNNTFFKLMDPINQ